MKRLAFDIETNGFNELIIDKKGNPQPEGDTVWCMVIKDIDTQESFKFTQGGMIYGVGLLREATLLIGHNIIMFDIPFLERIYGPIDCDVYDTLIVSRLMYPDRQNHPLGGNSLELWGKHLKIEKIDYTDSWDHYTDDMLIYCERDVDVTEQIFHAQQSFAEATKKPIELEHNIAKIISNQISNGINFDIHAADDLEQELIMEKVEIEDEMSRIFPPITEERISEKTGKRLKDRVTHFNPASRKQIAERLSKKYGWKPPKTKKGNPNVSSSILKGLRYPEAKTLVKYFDIIKLLSMTSDWITRARYSRDGRIHGSVNTQGTVTGRMTASQPNLQQVSGDKRARALFIPKEDWIQVGIDASGLEARLLASRMAKWDNGEYCEIVLNGDFHTINQQKADLPTRDDAKVFFFALIYGAGDYKIGRIINANRAVGKQIKEKFLLELPALKKLMEHTDFQVARKGTITLLDKREVPCRSQHKALNVQIQGDGAVLMKTAQKLFAKELENKYKGQYGFMATIHDEWQIECDPKIAEDIGKLGVDCITQSGIILGCNIKMDGEYRLGNNWAECH
jgi:DNA polymerase I-like protein with 3'-5' exonuclease and polymerase domains